MTVGKKTVIECRVGSTPTRSATKEVILTNGLIFLSVNHFTMDFIVARIDSYPEEDDR